MLAVAIVGMGTPLLLGAATADASGARVAVGAAARLPDGARFGQRLPASRRLRLMIALTPRDPAALRAFATAVSTPGTRQYGRYLSVADFARRFGATSARLGAVSAAMRAGGLRVGAPSANRLALPVSGSVAQVQRAFAVIEARVRLPDGRAAFANERAPRVPAGIAESVQAILGLDDIARQRPQPLIHTARAGDDRIPAARPRAVGSGPAPCANAVGATASMGGYTADEVAGAYGLGSYYPGDEGAGQTVALVEFEAYDPNDIAVYQQCYGTSAAVSNVAVDGGPGAFSGNDDESALDIDQVIGLAPKASIRVYQAPVQDSQAVVLNAIASENVAQVVSSSWGVCEALTGLPVIQAESTILQEMAVQGQSFFGASGDSGSTMCYQTPTGTAAVDDSLSVIDPGSQPFATGVGGTFLGNPDGTTPTSGAYAGEGVWNDGGADTAGDPAAGTGGGVSAAWTMPGYQSGAAAGLGVVQADSGQSCAGKPCRQVPDVSADADPGSGYVVWLTDPMQGSGWMIAGGTSASAPLWAAFTALANASPRCRGFTLGFENPALYAVAGSGYAANFHDVSSPNPFTGSSSNDTWLGANPSNPSGLYPVLAGYDMTTGLGSPIANVLGNSLCAVRAPAYTVHVTGPGNQISIKGEALTLAMRATDSGGAALTYSATGLPAGLKISATTGVIAGTPATRQTTTVTVHATDAFGNTGSTSYTWAVVVPGAPQLGSARRLRGVGKGRPKLTFSLAAGTFAPALKTVTIRLPGGLRFARKARALASGIGVKTGSEKVAVSLRLNRGALTITFRSPLTRASVMVGGPAITVSPAEALRVSAHTVKRLVIAVKATDASRRTTSLRIVFTKLS